jgi:hypothetical protein
MLRWPDRSGAFLEMVIKIRKEKSTFLLASLSFHIFFSQVFEFSIQHREKKITSLLIKRKDVY